MNIQNIIIIIFILIFIILITLYFQKKWIFEEETPEFDKLDFNVEGGCRTDLQSCKCPIEYQDLNGKVVNTKLSNYEIEKDFYKVRQDIMPYWSNWSECNSYGLTTRKRIKGDNQNSQFDVFDQSGFLSDNTKSNDPLHYKLYPCDIIPCENYGTEEYGAEGERSICRTRSDGTNDSLDNDDYKYNILRCNPIISFTDTDTIKNSCRNQNDQIPFNSVNFDQSLSVPAKENFNYGFNNREHPVLIGIE